MEQPGREARVGEGVGSQIGAYRLLERIGEGGFGVVYAAEQVEPVRRRVALKVIKAGMDSEQVVARFEAERQALAVMDHPCIAKVFDGGVTPPEMGARPYFVMELVKGEPITEFCDKNRLSVRERCELMIRVCNAVQHAHTKGVVHRDLKPNNILVAYDADGGATPKVIDFGIAKALNQRLSEKTIFTERGKIIGTPEYMSPEQAEMSGLDIDTRSDVYSLGVVLYALLTGSLPFTSEKLRDAAYAELIRIIKEEEPEKPSTRVLSQVRVEESTSGGSRLAKARHTDARSLTSTLRRDLDWVVMTCLEKDRSRRYGTASALGEELHRYLDDEPVVAGPPSVGYRVGKFVKRNRRAMVASGLVLGATFSAAVSFGWGLWREAGLLAQVQREKEAGISAFELVNKVIAEEAGRGGLSKGERLDRVREQIESADVGALAKSRLEWGLGQAYLGAGLTERSEQAFRQAVLHAGAAGREGARTEALAKLALAESLYRLDRAEESRRYASEAVSAMTGLSGVDELETLNAHATLAGATKRMGQNADDAESGRALLERSREMYSELSPRYVGLLGADAIESIECEYDLALVDSLLGRQGDAIARMEPLQDRIARVLTTHSDLWIGATAELGLMKAQAGDFQGGMALYEYALDGAEWDIGPAHWRTIQIWERVGNLRYAMERYEEAGVAFEEAIERHRVVNGEFHPKTLYVHKRLAMARVRQGQVESGLGAMLRLYEEMESEPRVNRSWLRAQAGGVRDVMQLAGREEDAKEWGELAEP